MMSRRHPRAAAPGAGARMRSRNSAVADEGDPGVVHGVAQLWIV